MLSEVVLVTMVDTIGCLPGNLVGLGLLQSVSYIKSIPTHEKIFCCGKKVAQMSLLIYFFLDWVGLGLGSFVGFMIIFVCLPTQQKLEKSQTP